jgi:lantibiotic transport system permease protein
MHQFILSLQSEFYKSRRTIAFWGAVVLPVIICTVIAIGYFVNSSIFINTPGELQWARYIGSILGIMGTFLLPMFVVFIAFSVNNMEHRSEMWKSLFALPLNRWSIYGSKYVFAVILIAICLGLFNFLLVISGNLLGWLKPEMKFQDYNVTTLAFTLHLKLFLSALGILSIQFMLSLLWADFLKPMGVGLVGTIFGLISANSGWEHAYIIPYAHPVLGIMSTRTKGTLPEVSLVTNEIYVSISVAIAAFIIGYYMVTKRSIK